MKRFNITLFNIFFISLLIINGCHTLPPILQPEVPPELPIENAGQPDISPELPIETAGKPVIIETPEIPYSPPESTLLNLTFAGDIMAHTVNYSMKEYDRIYDDVRPLLSGDDLSFANLEAPVADNIPMSTYPRFNVHLPYIHSAIQGGFDVFALANNHSNDQGVSGIAGTLASMATVSANVFYSGLKKKSSEQLEPVVIRKKDWTVLFLSVTEILNSYDASGKMIYYVAPTEIARSVFLSEIRRMRSENPCDLFILSIHLNEPEYVRTVNEAKKNWFLQLASEGVDIVWGHHPHVMQSWEEVMISDGTTDRPVLFMYSMGNFISGQRYIPEKENPGGLREYTGDAALLQVKVSRDGKSGYTGFAVSPVLVTNYSDPFIGGVVRLFNDGFISSLPDLWKVYYRKRFEYMYEYLPLLPSAPIAGIMEQ